MDNEVQYYFHSSDCVVLPYKEIFTSGAAMLALTFRKPIIIKKCDFSEEYLNADNSILMDACDESHLGRGLETFIDERQNYSVKDEVMARYQWSRISHAFLNDPKVKVFLSKTKTLKNGPIRITR